MWFEYLLSFFSIYVVVAVVAATHALLYVRDSRAAFGWLGLIVVFPIAGALLYALFGINRVRRKAQRISQDTDSEPLTDPVTHQATDGVLRNRPGYNITGRRVVPGNSVATLYNGEQAFPEMLEAIDQAQKEVLLSSYIFDNDDYALRIADLLKRRSKDGVDVKDSPVTEGDFFATIYSALGVDPTTENYSGVRPIPLAPFGHSVVDDILA